MRTCPWICVDYEHANLISRVGLTARLFSENLLDHDHFLEWFLSSFEAASIVTIPIWLLMLGIYWKNIMRYRRRGRRLAELLLHKVRQVCSTCNYLVPANTDI